MLLSMLLLSTVLVIIVGCIYLYFLYDFDYWQRCGVECIEKPNFLFGNAWGIFRASHNICLIFYEWYKQIQGPFAGAYIMNEPILLIKDPETLRRVLVKDFNNFCDRAVYIDEEKEPLSGYLFRLTGDRWRFMRSKLSPAFTIGKLKIMFETFELAGNQWEKALGNITERGSEVNISEHSLKFVSDAIASTIFGIQVNSFNDPSNHFYHMVQSLLENQNLLRYYIFLLATYTPHLFSYLGLKSVYKKTNEQILELVKEVVEYREKNKVTRNDFMQLLIQLKNTGEVSRKDSLTNDCEKDVAPADGLSIYEMSAAAYSMFFAGIDTSATTIQYCLYHLAKNTEIQVRLQEDIDRTLAKYDGNISYESIMEMHYLEQVLNETLRLYPILAFLQRISLKDYNIPEFNVTIKKGTSIYVSIYGLHHNSEHFSDPEKFDPERFSSENKANIKPYTYMPFGEGPRNCIGKRLGYVQSAYGVVQMLKNNRVSVCEKTPSQIQFKKLYLTINPSEPIILNVTKRDVKFCNI